MDADASGATQDYSSALRMLTALLAVTGAFLLVLSTFTTVVEIRVLTTSDLEGQDTQIFSGDLHGIALVVVALAAVVVLTGALRGVRPAMIALAATGLLALGLVVGLDVPELDNAGRVGRLYEDVSAGASTGFSYEVVGGVLLLLAGGGLLALRDASRSG